MKNKKLKRILIKLSGEALMGDGDYGINIKTVDKLAKDLVSLKKENLEICIVIGGGNIFRGVAASVKGMDRANADYMGMLATVINSLALQKNLQQYLSLYHKNLVVHHQLQEDICLLVL